jgi:hypothetical protein
VTPLKVHLVLNPENAGWIIEKIAARLMEHAPVAGIAASISGQPRSDVHLNHWMSYAFADEPQSTRATMFITHVDDPYKSALVRRVIAGGVDAGICMSGEMMAQLVALGVPQRSLCFIPPAHDNLVRPRRVRIGIATRLYPDGRKRESLLVQLGGRIRLDCFRFEIFGAGWEKVIPELKASGAEVDYYPGTGDYRSDYQVLLEHVPHFDYYLYMGMDEGSLGTLDALAAAVKTIVTAQGFHLDLGSAITHSFVTFEELEAIFIRIRDELAARTAIAARLTWGAFAERHATVWRAITGGVDLRSLTELTRLTPIDPARDLRCDVRFWMRSLHPRRVLSAMGHVPVLKPLRTRWGHARRARAKRAGSK